jgi:diguanylate cyclase (GGDEF)-like protein
VLVVQGFLGLAVILAVGESAQWGLTATQQQLKEAQHRLKVLGETDPLTGCFNRQVFRELVDDLRSGGRGQHGVVLLVDLEGFRALNEREGQAGGDDALRRAAEAIRSRTRATDVLVRWGGDEFVLVLQGVGRSEAQARRAEIAEALGRAGLSARSGVGVYGPGSDIMAAVQEAEREQGPEVGRRQAEA